MRITRSQAHADPSLSHEVTVTFNQAVGLAAPQAPALPASLQERLQALVSNEQLGDMLTMAEGVRDLKAKAVQLINSPESSSILAEAQGICEQTATGLFVLHALSGPEAAAAKAALATDLQYRIASIARGASIQHGDITSIEDYKAVVLDMAHSLNALIDEPGFAPIRGELQLVKQAVVRLNDLVTNSEATATLENGVIAMAAQAMALAEPATRLFTSFLSHNGIVFF